MQVIARAPGERCFHLRMFVGRVVVLHQVHGKVGRDLLVDQAQKRQDFLVKVAWLVLRDHLAGSDIERGEESCRAGFSRASSIRNSRGPRAELAGCGPALGSGISRPRRGLAHGPAD